MKLLSILKRLKLNTNLLEIIIQLGLVFTFNVKLSKYITFGNFYWVGVEY
jgi:hypothetical protein